MGRKGPFIHLLDQRHTSICGEFGDVFPTLTVFRVEIAQKVFIVCPQTTSKKKLLAGV